MDEAAKKWLAVSLLCKQLRSNIESMMADLESARLQIIMQPEHPTSQTLEKVNQILRGSAAERERTLQALNRMSFITQVSMEQTVGELERYGIKEQVIDEEFQKLKSEMGIKETEKTTYEAETLKLPEVPKKTQKKETEEEKDAEKG